MRIISWISIMLFSSFAAAVEVGGATQLACQTTSGTFYKFSAEWTEDAETIFVKGPVLAGTYAFQKEFNDGSETFSNGTVTLRIALPMVNKRMNGSWASDESSGFFQCMSTNWH